MAGHRAAADLAQRRVFGPADILGKGAAGVKAAARRQILRAGHLAQLSGAQKK